MYKKGFTLIELLVVIAIIGILTTVVLTFLGGARNSGRDAAMKQQLNSLKTEITLRFGDQTSLLACGGSAGNIWVPTSGSGCRRNGAIVDVDGDVGGISVLQIGRLIGAATSTAGSNGSLRVKVNDADGSGAGTTGNEWAVAGVLSSDSSGNTWWCVDSRNVSKQVVIGGAVTNPIYNTDSTRAYCN